jgi:hypothetical protein
MTGSTKTSRLGRHRRTPWVARLVLAATLVPFVSAVAAAAMTLQVEAANGLPGFHRADLSRYLAAHMAETGIPDWRFAPAEGDSSALDRVEWSFKSNPSAGGEVRNFAHNSGYERELGLHRPITIEARLYINGEYQTLVATQVIFHGGPNDPALAAAIASATQSLLGPSGAYRAIETGRPAYPSR